jgi:hypothetical protein
MIREAVCEGVGWIDVTQDRAEMNCLDHTNDTMREADNLPSEQLSAYQGLCALESCKLFILQELRANYLRNPCFFALHELGKCNKSIQLKLEKQGAV